MFLSWSYLQIWQIQTVQCHLKKKTLLRIMFSSSRFQFFEISQIYVVDRSFLFSIKAIMVFLVLICTDFLMKLKGRKPSTCAYDSSSCFLHVCYHLGQIQSSIELTLSTFVSLLLDTSKYRTEQKFLHAFLRMKHSALANHIGAKHFDDIGIEIFSS